MEGSLTGQWGSALITLSLSYKQSEGPLEWNLFNYGRDSCCVYASTD